MSKSLKDQLLRNVGPDGHKLCPGPGALPQTGFPLKRGLTYHIGSQMVRRYAYLAKRNTDFVELSGKSEQVPSLFYSYLNPKFLFTRLGHMSGFLLYPVSC